MIDYSDLHNKVREIMAISLHRQEHGEPTGSTVAEFKAADEMPRRRYLNEPLFHAQVDRVTAQVMHEVTSSLGKRDE